MTFQMNKSSFPTKIKCPDFLNIHRKNVYSSQRNNQFTKLEALARLLKNIFPEKNIAEDDYICKNCYARFASKFQVSSNEKSESEEPEVFEELDCIENFPIESNDQDHKEDLYILNKSELRQEMNEEFFRLNNNISPLLQVSNFSRLTEKGKSDYTTRKRKEISDANDEATYKKLKNIYDYIPPLNTTRMCDDLITNFGSALKNCKNNSEKLRLLTIIPDSFFTSDVVSKLETSKYCVEEAKKLKNEKGIYCCPDPNFGHPLNEDDVKLALEYYLNDDFDCSRQSPNKNDVVRVKENGIVVKRVKRYITRSIREIYQKLTEENPTIKISRAKFYSLRPKWVIIDPPTEACLCLYCANFELCITALKSLRKDLSSNSKEVQEELFSIITCASIRDECKLQTCQKCPGVNAITANSLNLSDYLDEEVQFVLWNNSELEKRSTSLNGFIIELKKCTEKAVTHLYIKRTQQEKIRQVKEEAKEDAKKAVIHYDFAENWKVISKNEIQSAYWKTNSLSIFTAVCYSGVEVQSFAVVSNDVTHDTAHALLAFNWIFNFMKTSEKFKRVKELTVVSDGAAAHFKNRYQFYELRNSKIRKNWVFSATGHGKGACDAIGGLVKHYASLHNLQKSQLQSITDAETFVSTVKSYTKAITLLFLSTKDIESFRIKKLKQWKKVKKIPGIQKSHCWKTECKNKKKLFFSARTAKTEWHQIKV